MVKENDTVLIKGKEYTLGARIGGGSEGSIFDVKDGLDSDKKKRNFVIKIINDKNITKRQKEDVFKHLKWLCDIGSQYSEIREISAIPKALLDNHLGYIMFKADEHESLKKYTEVPDLSEFENWYKKKYTLKRRYQIIIGLFDALRKLHLAGLVYTDLSPSNIMVHKNKNQIVLIDTDNIRTRRDSYLGVIGTPGYIAPEVYLNRDLEKAKECNIKSESLSKDHERITPDSDIFSAAVIAFELLTLQHPFIGDEVESGTSAREEEAFEIKTDYIFKKGTNNSSTRNLVPNFSDLTTREVRELFYRTFVDGKNNPYLRPTDNEFLEAFQNAYDKIAECRNCGYSRIYSLENGSNKSNKCINCEKEIGPKVVLRVKTLFENMNRADLINSIGNYPEYDVDIKNLKDSAGKETKAHSTISEIVLESGEEKYLYLRHFEENTNRSKEYVRIVLSSEERLSVKILNNKFENAYLCNINTKEQKPIKNEEEKVIKYNEDAIFFDEKKQGKRILKTYGICKKV